MKEKNKYEHLICWSKRDYHLSNYSIYIIKKMRGINPDVQLTVKSIMMQIGKEALYVNRDKLPMTVRYIESVINEKDRGDLYEG